MVEDLLAVAFVIGCWAGIHYTVWWALDAARSPSGRLQHRSRGR